MDSGSDAENSLNTENAEVAVKVEWEEQGSPPEPYLSFSVSPTEAFKVEQEDLEEEELHRIESDVDAQSETEESAQCPAPEAQELSVEAEQSIRQIVDECLQVLNQDPRIYHPFYLRIYKYATIGQKLGFLREEDGSLSAFWQKWDDLARNEWEQNRDNESRQQVLDNNQSPYLQYLLSGKCIVDGRPIPVEKRHRLEAEVEEIVSKLQQKWGHLNLTPTQILDQLELRREFFEQVKHVTSPADTEVMNTAWRKLLQAPEAVSVSTRTSARKRKPPSWLLDQEEEEEPAPRKQRKKIEPVGVTLKDEDATECPHCRRKVTTAAQLEKHIARMHVITLDGKVINRPSGKDLKGLSKSERQGVWREWQRQRRLHRPEEEKLKERTRVREKYLQKLEAMTEEERCEWRKKRQFYRLQKRLEVKSLSEEERERRKMANWLRNQAVISEKGKEWRRQKIEKAKAWNRNKRARMTEEERLEQRRKHKEYRQRLQGDKLQRYKESVRRSVKKYFERLKRENYADWWNRTTGQQRLRWDDVLSYQRERVRKETPEQRVNRLLRYRINQAKRRKRQELEKEGVTEEQAIVKELEKVEAQIRAQAKDATVSEYKPRPGARKPHKVKNARVPPWEMKEQTPNAVEATAPVQETQIVEPVNIAELVTFAPIAPGGDSVQAQTFSVEFHEATPTLTLVQSTEVATAGTCVSTSTSAQTLHSLTSTGVQLNFSGEAFAGAEQPNIIFLTEEQAQTLQPLTADGTLQPSQIILVSSSLVTSPEPQQMVTTNVEAIPVVFDDLQESEPVPSPEKEVEIPVKRKPAESSLPPSKQPAICDTCGKSFTTQASVHLHKNLVHPADPSLLVCPKCGVSRSSTLSLWNHFISQHLSSEIDPLLPSSLFPKRPSAPQKSSKKECRSDPGGNLFTCPTCSKGFVQKCTLDDHIRRVHQGKGHFCSECGKDQQSTAKLWRHKVERHGMRELAPPEGVPAISCKYCQELIMRGYEQHVRKRHPEQLSDFQEWYVPSKGTAPKTNSSDSVQCPQCPSVVKARLLNRHIKNMHTARPKHPCPECGYQFKRLDHMKKHFRDHHAVADIERKLEAKQLIRIQSLNRNFWVSCLLCGEEIRSKVLLRAHFVQEHHEIFQQCQVATLPIFECLICQDKFGKESALNKHLEQAHRDKLFTCVHCGTWKISEAELRAHEKSHAKVAKLGRCELCNFEVPAGPEAEESLKEHARTEHSEGFRECPNENCSKWSAKKEEMRNHARRCQRNGRPNIKTFVEQHLNKLVVRCEECGKPQRLNLLGKHLRLKHGGEEAEGRQWTCEQCESRVFKDRRYHVAHMHLAHQLKVEELLDLVEEQTTPAFSRVSTRRSASQRRKAEARLEEWRQELERHKRLVISVERLSDDLANFYLARQILVKVETACSDNYASANDQ